MKIIKKMTCAYCGTEDCRFMILTDESFIDVDKNGIITTSEDSNAIVGEHISDCFSKLHINDIIGSCNDEGDDAQLNVEFTDGTTFNSKEREALEYLLS